MNEYTIEHCGPDHFVCERGGHEVCAAFEREDAQRIARALQVLPLVEQMMNVAQNAYVPEEGRWSVADWLREEPTVHAVLNALTPESARAGAHIPALA